MLPITCSAGPTPCEDLNHLRDDVPYMDALGSKMTPTSTVAGDFMRRFAEADEIKLMQAFNAVRPRLWRGRDRERSGGLDRWGLVATVLAPLGLCIPAQSN